MESTSSILSEILAKSNPRQALVEHSREAATCLLGFLSAFPRQVEQTAKAARIPSHELVSQLFAAVWLHDIGKANQNFQLRIRGGDGGTPIPHPLLSVPFALAATPPIRGIPYAAVAVMSHHSPYYSGLYGAIETDLRASCICDAASEFYRMLPLEHRRFLGYDYPFELSNPTQWNSHALVCTIRDKVSDYPPADARDVFGFLLAAVHYGDWLSSGHRKKWHYELPDLSEQVRISLDERRRSSGSSFSGRVASGIQCRAVKTKGHLLVAAPTGAGKTEAALLWAGKQEAARLTYLLPTRVTSNAMYNRIRGYSGDLVGLSHGMAGLVIGERDGYNSMAFASRLYHSTFMQPATVATVDQLLLAKFNWSHWGLVETNIAESAVIFDEIHAYDLYTLGLILSAAHELARSGAQLCFMSATMPEFLRAALGQLLQLFGGHTYIDCPEASHEERHILHVRNQPLPDVLPEIEIAFQQGRRILVVANTVGGAGNFYQLIRDRIGPQNTMLFHSRFIEQDRTRLEARIATDAPRGGGFVAVVTQIVEVSLDIDYDVMFTQVAPVDALVQRFGRVNRRGLKGLAPVYVLEADQGSWKVYADALSLNGVLDLLRDYSGRPIRQTDIVDWLTRQYPTEAWLQATLSSKVDAEQQVREVRRKLWQMQTLQFSDEGEAIWKLAQSRREQFPSLEVVPECFRQHVERCEHPIERQRYMVRVPAYLVSHKSYDKERGVLFADVDYDEEFGVIGEVATIRK
jgi:CRISPR-associated endonuclease/helicase Cas3